MGVRMQWHKLRNQFRAADSVIAGPVHVVVSPFKTGTTSVGRALVEMGVGRAEMPSGNEILQTHQTLISEANALTKEDVGFKAFRAEHSQHIRTKLQPIVHAISPFDVFQDAPFGHTHLHPFVRKILAPRAKFIWVNRDRDSWLESVQQWEQSHPHLYSRHDKWRTDPDGEAELRMTHWRAAFRCFKRMRRGAPNDCLLLEWDDLQTYDRLAGFYGVAPPDAAFPKENMRRKHRQLRS